MSSTSSIVRLKLSQLRLERPRQWGGCWLALELWRELQLDAFWAQRLPPTRKGTRWDQVLAVLVVYRLLSPGSEWRLHRQWYQTQRAAGSAGCGSATIDIHTLYDCHDRLLEHKQALFDHLVGRWRDLFNVSFDVLLYDLTSTYFESIRRSRMRTSVASATRAIIVPTACRWSSRWWSRRRAFRWPTKCWPATPRTTPRSRTFWHASSASTARRDGCGCMDRGMPTEEVLAQMRASDPPVQYLVGTPKGRLTRLEQALLEKPWMAGAPGGAGEAAGAG